MTAATRIGDIRLGDLNKDKVMDTAKQAMMGFFAAKKND
jgi:hypothetical protein